MTIILILIIIILFLILFIKKLQNKLIKYTCNTMIDTVKFVSFLKGKKLYTEDLEKSLHYYMIFLNNDKINYREGID